MSDARHDELAGRLQQVEQRIQEACRQAGRDRDEITLVVVTKYFPAADVERLAALGVTDVGENKAQEMTAKVAELDPGTRERLRIHFIGQLQTNKARQVVEVADLVHAVDRPRLVRALDKAAGEAGRSLDVLLQVDLDPAAAEGDLASGGGRGGAAPGDIRALAGEVDGCAHLDLRGVMAVAPLGADPGEAFGRLADVARSVRDGRPGAVVVSAGMSGDLEAAVAHGATHLRVGSAILGARPAPR